MGFRPAGLKAPLRLETDAATGRVFALYTLEPDETLYSVLIRFTDRERADEVNRLSAILVRLNKLKGATRIPPGKALRIPLEWISDDYLIGRPGGSAPTAAAAPAPAGAAAPAAPPPSTPAHPTPANPAPVPRKPPATKRPLPGLVPMHVILDPGHGGVDPGAVYGSRRQGDQVYEHEVVFDIALRLAQILEARGNKVYPLVRNPGQIRPVETLSTRGRGQEELATTPPYPMDSVHVAVNLRVYLVDAIYRRLIRQGIPADQIVLLSIHGDALAPTLRGAMIYYPDFRLRTPEFRPEGHAYRARTDARARLIRFTDAENRVAQDASRGLAELVLQQLDAQQVRVSPRKSARSFYYRDGVRTLPAVLRYSRVPQSILVEVANLNNPEDRRELLRGGARQRIAEGLAAAVDAYRLRQAQIAKREE
jgi:N-acetylmuramoyl-L-alanine amidase